MIEQLINYIFEMFFNLNKTPRELIEFGQASATNRQTWYGLTVDYTNSLTSKNNKTVKSKITVRHKHINI